jgi:hypothetical protein
MFLGREIESGYDSEHWIDYPDEVLTPEPIGSLASQDVYARRRVLTLALKAKQPLTPAQLSQAVSDPDMYVRRIALRIIAQHKVQGASATALKDTALKDTVLTDAVLKALHDPENTVSCLAAIALAEASDARGMQTLLVAAFDPQSTFQFNSRAVPQALKKWATTEPGGATLKKLLVPRLRDQSPRTRELTLYYFTLIGAPATPEVEQSLTEIARHGDGEYARELALVNLSSSFGATTDVAQTLRTVMRQDPSHAVQVRAASLFAAMHARLPAKDNRRVQALARAVEFFRQYGDGCARTDRAWGWRLLGNSLLQFGPDGAAALKALMAQANSYQTAPGGSCT